MTALGVLDFFFFGILILAVVVAIVGFTLPIYYSHIRPFLDAIRDITLAARVTKIAPTPLLRFLSKHIKFRIRREDQQYCLEFRTVLTTWYSVPLPTYKEYGHYRVEHWNTDIEVPRQRIKAIRADIQEWLEQSKQVDYSQYDDRVIETIKYGKDSGM